MLGDLLAHQPWTNLKPNSVETKSVKTDNLLCDNLNVDRINVDTINYNTITCRDQAIRLNPLYIVNNSDKTFDFIDNHYLDFEIISNLSDVQMQESTMLISNRIPGIVPDYISSQFPLTCI